MESHLQLYPGQQVLTPAQEAEARRFFAERIQAQLSTEPVDEQETEALLRQAYRVAGLAPPQHIEWVDSPLQLRAVLSAQSLRNSVEARVYYSVKDRVEASVKDRVGASVRSSVMEHVYYGVETGVVDSVGGHIPSGGVRASVVAYLDANWLAFYQFFDVYLAPNDLHALARFNELVSGYWLGEALALVVRRPRRLCRDAEGRLHSTSGRCLEYHDGWGFHAWHGVRVPGQVILDPDSLTRDDFLHEKNAEVRRVMQERMGQRFVPELGGVVIDSGLRGTLYEVALPEDDPDDDPERVARYVLVQDASSERRYFLRVPPTIQTAAEAVAWTFGLSPEAYGPTHET